jgi:hypothetical protein
VRKHIGTLRFVNLFLTCTVREVYRNCNSHHKSYLLLRLRRLLTFCRGFIGDALFVEYILLLMPAVDDEVPNLRRAARETMDTVLLREKQYSQWGQICAALVKRWLRSVETAGRLAEASSGGQSETGIVLGSLILPGDREDSVFSSSAGDSGQTTNLISDTETKFHNALSMALGSGNLLQSNLNFAVASLSAELVKYLQVMFIPDVTVAHKSMVLESRRFYFARAKECYGAGPAFCDVGYYRAPLLCTRQTSGLKLCKRFAAFLGGNGACKMTSCCILI